jgi:hypothetical protein
MHNGWRPHHRTLFPGETVETCVKNGAVRRIGSLATELLDLSLPDASVLFSPSNTLLQLWVIASVLTNGEIEVPLDVVDQFKGGDERLKREYVAARARLTRATSPHQSFDWLL